MDPPTPCFEPESSITKETEKKSEKSFNVISDKNNEFNLKFINASKYILIIASCKKDIINTEYEKNYCLSDLIENKFLSILSSIEEIYEQIIMIIENKKNILIKEEDSHINIVIPIDNFLKVKEIKFTLPEKIKSEKELVAALFNELSYVKKDLYEKNKKLEEDNKFLKEEVKYIKEKLDILINENNKLKEEKKINIPKEEENITSIKEEIIKSSSIVNNDLEKQSAILKKRDQL